MIFDFCLPFMLENLGFTDFGSKKIRSLCIRLLFHFPPTRITKSDMAISVLEKQQNKAKTRLTAQSQSLLTEKHKPIIKIFPFIFPFLVLGSLCSSFIMFAIHYFDSVIIPPC
ncbi:hypothetical protein L1887_36381 [Cichorium endivia]|nr:hypothetical protein L1887_36381 [Cichorium endivia]